MACDHCKTKPATVHLIKLRPEDVPLRIELCGFCAADLGIPKRGVVPVDKLLRELARTPQALKSDIRF
ncbi:MAG: hypothetical protein JWM99_4237 [Verrucomicrobiales bacterium]|jgi:protein-arginine kinase activator protein McsA|nr:hypothetical protein [Verrucomicrobiales bacterium]